MPNEEEESAGSDVDHMMENALASLDAGQFEEAAELFRQVVRVAPLRHDAREYLALALDRQLAQEIGEEPPASRPAPPLPAETGEPPRRIRRAGTHVSLWTLAIATGLLVLVVAVVAGSAVVRHMDFSGWIKPTEKDRPVAAVRPENRVVTEAVMRADIAITRQAFDEALTVLRQARATSQIDARDARQLDDKMGDVFAARAESHIAKLNYDKALESADEGLQISSASVRLNYIVGVCYERKGIYAQKKDERQEFFNRAVGALETAVAEDPDNLRALELLANVYTKIFQPAKAIEIWDRIISIAPTSPEARKARGYKQSLGFRSTDEPRPPDPDEKTTAAKSDAPRRP